MIICLSGCIGFAHIEQRVKKMRKETKPAKSKIFKTKAKGKKREMKKKEGNDQNKICLSTMSNIKLR